MRFILSSFFISFRFLAPFMLSVSFIAILLASCSVFRYYDLKKIIAFSSIVHLNFILAQLFCLNSLAISGSIIVSIAHGFSSVTGFLLVGILINKTYSRYVDSFFFIDQITRLLLLLFILSNMSFAISMNFVGEIFCLVGLFSIDCL